MRKQVLDQGNLEILQSQGKVPITTQCSSTLDLTFTMDPQGMMSLSTNNFRTPPDSPIQSCWHEPIDQKKTMTNQHQCLWKRVDSNLSWRAFLRSMAQQTCTGLRPVKAPANSLEKKRTFPKKAVSDYTALLFGIQQLYGTYISE